jgi:putative flippase GtrA
MQLLLYAVIGAVCAVVNVLLFGGLLGSGLPVAWAAAAAFGVAAILNYFLCILILFQHKARWSTVGELIAYLATVSIMGLADVGLTVGFISSGMAPTWSKIISVLIGFAGNFLFRRFLVFPKPPIVRV